MNSVFKQHFPFKESTTDDTTEQKIRWNIEKHLRIRDEIVRGWWDYDRLSVDRHAYEEIAHQFKGVTKFRYPSTKHKVIEARAALRFLAVWQERYKALSDESARLGQELNELAKFS